MPCGKTHHGFGQAGAQLHVLPLQLLHMGLFVAVAVQARGLAQWRGSTQACAHQRQVHGDTRGALLHQLVVHTVRQHVFGHGAVGGPLAAGHGDQAAAADQHGVFAADGLGVGALFFGRLDQRAQAHPDAFHVGCLGGLAQVTGRFGEDEVHLFLEGRGLQVQACAGCVCGAQDDLAQPWHGKQHTAIAGFGHQQGGVAAEEFFVHHDVHTLAGGDDGFGHGCRCARSGVLLTQRVHPYACGVDHAARLDGVSLPAQHVFTHQAADVAALVLQRHRLAVVDQQRTLGGRRACQRQRQAGVVELAVPVLHAALQPVGRDHRHQCACFRFAQKTCAAQACLARQQVVSGETRAVERRFPPLVRRHHKSQRLGQVGRVVQQRGALV